MIKKLICLFFLIMSLQITANVSVSSTETLRIAAKIWYNESGGSIEGLTDWNDGENFASVGIGHFVWYPIGTHLHEAGGFANLLHYMQSHGVRVPNWLITESIPHCPWISREDFYASQYSPLMLSLRQFLMATMYWQARYMIERMQRALPRMLASVPPEERPYIRYQFNRIASTPTGIYALTDYINFKGEGIGYSSQTGWGLLQVLEMMRYAPSNYSRMQQFSWAADQVLTRRVEQAPAYMSLWRWLPGWRHRIRSYMDPMQQ